MSMLPRRKIGSRACDACKIRKVRCSEQPPCARCVSIGIDCTFNKRQATRGPRSLRSKTLQEIRNIQERQAQDQSPSRYPGRDSIGSLPGEVSTDGVFPGDQQSPCGGETSPAGGTNSEPNKTPVSSLIVRLCIYRLRLFPVWPILAAEDVIASLFKDPADLATYTLANAVCAAIIAQLKLPFEGRTDDNDPATAASMAAECARTKALLQDRDDGPDATLNMLRIAFFQHIYHENQTPGGKKSLMFLREAITIAQIMGLHRKSSYALLSPDEQQIRRRILWLLFVTERGVAMLHKFPIVLRWQPGFPPLEDKLNIEHDEAHILPAFKKLVDLFWIFDQSGAFDLLIQAEDNTDVHQRSRLEYLQQRLQDISSDLDESNDVQKADICVTKCWMQAVVWRASLRRPKTAVMFAEENSIYAQPYRIVSEFLSHICHYSKTALEAHGPTIELKIFEIANALTDALATNLDLLRGPVAMDVRPVDMLIQLQRLLASSRGGNKALLTLLCARIAEVENAGSPELRGSPPEIPPTHAGEVDDDDKEDGYFGTGFEAARRDLFPGHLNMNIGRLNSHLPLPVWSSPWQDSSQATFNIDGDGSPGIMFTQLTNESWNGWL
ncbi:putative sucrose utilization protein SUC1 [Cytospora mali]|uniref:Sucrose utilization protein SUC1 n=1 Tax=Cytospora mali TaxID=578113 RepID=A0A194VLG2_CYTMA|nr:putative sucrose utilization protein SUC1 [Valsa mali]